MRFPCPIGTPMQRCLMRPLTAWICAVVINGACRAGGGGGHALHMHVQLHVQVLVRVCMCSGCAECAEHVPDELTRAVCPEGRACWGRSVGVLREVANTVVDAAPVDANGGASVLYPAGGGGASGGARGEMWTGGCRIVAAEATAAAGVVVVTAAGSTSPSIQLKSCMYLLSLCGLIFSVASGMTEWRRAASAKRECSKATKAYPLLACPPAERRTFSGLAWSSGPKRPKYDEMSGTSTVLPPTVESLSRSPTQTVRSSSLSAAWPVGSLVVWRWLAELWLLLLLLLAELGRGSSSRAASLVWLGWLLLPAPGRRLFRFTGNGWWRVSSTRAAWRGSTMATNAYGRSRSVRAPQILTVLTGPGCSKVQSERRGHTLAAAPHAAAGVYAAEALPWSEWSGPDPKRCVSGGWSGKLWHHGRRHFQHAAGPHCSK